MPLATLAVTALSFRLLPTERRDIRNSLLFLAASLIGILASTVFHRLELPGMASTLKEMFLIIQGIALRLDKSVEVGDWIKADDVVGKVVDIRWRSTVVGTRDWETVVIPDSRLMKNKFSVFGQRDGQPVRWRRWVWFNVDLKTAPFHAIRTAEAAIRGAEIANVADRPLPNWVLMEFEKNYGRYALRYWLTDPAVDDPTDSAVRVRLYTAFQRAGIRLATPEESRHIVKESEKHEQAVHQRELAHRLAALQKVELFNTLRGEEQATIADHLQYAPFSRGGNPRPPGRRGPLAVRPHRTVMANRRPG